MTWPKRVYVTHLSLMEFPNLNIWTNPFRIKRLLSSILHFIQIYK